MDLETIYKALKNGIVVEGKGFVFPTLIVRGGRIPDHFLCDDTVVYFDEIGKIWDLYE